VKTYADTLKYLYGLQQRGIKFGLRNINALLDSVGNPQSCFPSIHIAGTNGKGSTASFLASIMMEAGYTTALYTSPHLVRFTERIKINGKEIPERRLVLYVQRLRPIIEEVKATFFEATTCIALQYFADEKVAVAIIETGLGGRLDATNVLRPLLSVITNISREHTEYLGKTLRSIAREKGGIIKPGLPCLTGSSDPSVLRTLKTIAERRGAALYRVRQVAHLRVGPGGAKKPIVHITTRRYALRRVRIGLRGTHQALNAHLAVAALEIVVSEKKLPEVVRRVTARTIVRGLERVGRNTALRGRLESLGAKGRFILDVAHNPASIQTLVCALEQERIRDVIVVFGVMKDKEYGPMLETLRQIALRVIGVSPALDRALGSQEIYYELTRRGIAGLSGGSVIQGIRKADTLAGPHTRILITGSHYVVGEAIAYLGKKA